MSLLTDTDLNTILAQEQNWQDRDNTLLVDTKKESGGIYDGILKVRICLTLIL